MRASPRGGFSCRQPGALGHSGFRKGSSGLPEPRASWLQRTGLEHEARGIFPTWDQNLGPFLLWQVDPFRLASNQRITASQRCTGFCHQHESATGMYLDPPPTLHPSYPSRLSQSAGLLGSCMTMQGPSGGPLYLWTRTHSTPCSLGLHPLLPPLCPGKSVL